MKPISKKTFLLLFTLIVIIAFFMRSYKLAAKPIHHDEAVLEYYYVEPLLENYALPYLGIEFHGLAPHFLTYPFVRIFGLSIFSMRFATAVFGTLTVVLLYFLKDYIGKIGVLFSAAFLAISPTFVYYSRQYTSYPFFIFFLILLIMIVLKFLKEHKTYQLYLIFVLIAIILNINEIFFIFLFIVAAFIYLNYLFNNFKIRLPKNIKWKHFILGIVIFIFIFVVIHTNFFFQISNLEGLLNIYSDIAHKTVSTGHNKSFPYYFTLLFPFEFGLLLIGVIGLFYFKKDKFSYFLIFWSLTSLFIFSLMSYKTNWMLPVIILPLILHVGNTMNYLIERFKVRSSILIVGILLILISLFFSIQQNYIFYNDFEKNKIGYTETSPEVNKLTYDIKNYAKNRDIKILITANSYWPLPTYLKDYNIYYLTEIKKINTSYYSDYDVFISDTSQVPSLTEPFTKKEYELRKNYNLVVLYKNMYKGEDKGINKN